MSHLLNLPSDIYSLLDRGEEFSPCPTKLKEFGENMGKHVANAMSARKGDREKGKMWFSDLGETCDRKIWYKFNSKDGGEQLQGHTLHKFLYGDLIEEQVLYLAREAGHTVEYEQERIEYTHGNGWTISGRIDAVVDEVLTDVKSTSSYSYKKYKNEGINPANDSFGYRYQLSGYYHLSKPGWFNMSERPGFILVDKQNGHISVVPIDPIPKEDIINEIERVATIAESGSVDSFRRINVVADGKSGNEKLGIKCSYCNYKGECYPNLRTFAYSHGPVFLTKVVREPKVPEIINE